uniref:Uncharacterized protein n=1 Tax=Arundo donax TaxID=35708 RepID=A0A0A8XQF2_ARUDO
MYMSPHALSPLTTVKFALRLMLDKKIQANQLIFYSISI